MKCEKNKNSTSPILLVTNVDGVVRETTVPCALVTEPDIVSPVVNVPIIFNKLKNKLK